MDLNVNSAECIKGISNIGSTTYQNICNGTSSVVNWGIGDWIMIGSVVLFLVAMAAFFIYVIMDR